MCRLSACILINGTFWSLSSKQGPCTLIRKKHNNKGKVRSGRSSLASGLFIVNMVSGFGFSKIASSEMLGGVVLKIKALAAYHP